jgi:hypothetical protein
VLAYSPGFSAPPGGHGRSADFHLARHPRCVPHLEHAGRRLVYREFDGGHELPDEIAAEGLDLFLDGLESRT